MNLVIFDIDGTLTATNQVDNRCYEETFTQMFGFRAGPEDWHNLEHVTDWGILEGLLLNLRGRGPSPQELAGFKERFFKKLHQAHTRESDLFAPIPGALETMEALRFAPDWAVALATGGWRESALFKLRCAGFNLEGVVLATSDDAMARTNIVTKALERARKMNRGDGFTRIVSVGDGGWDVRAARELGLAFVGIGPKEKLRSLGAAHVRPDLSEPKEFLELLARAGLPRDPIELS